MAITNDAFGNFFLGNFVSPELCNSASFLNLMQLALGSNERVNINALNNYYFRVAWRPNLVGETLTGQIPVPFNNALQFPAGNAGAYILTANSRIELCFTSVGGGAVLSGLFADSKGVINPTNIFTFDTTTACNVVANKQSVAISAINGVNYYFLTQGFLLNSIQSFPNNAYTLCISGNATTGQLESGCFDSELIKNLHTFGTKANYGHTKLSDGLSTQSEVELYLRDATTDIPYGYIPNVFKWKVDGSEVAPAIGGVVRLNMANATGEYVGQGDIFCKVVGRLGNTSATDLTGDYLLMRIAG